MQNQRGYSQSFRLKAVLQTAYLSGNPMQLSRQLFQPQRMDAVALIVCILAILMSLAFALYGYDRAPVLKLTIFLVSMIAYSIGAAAGCKQISFGHAGILVFASVVAFAVVVMRVESDLNLNFVHSYEKWFLKTRTSIWTIPLLCLASFLGHWLLRQIADRMSNRISSVKRDEQQRLRWLMGLALLMFVMHQVIQFSHFRISPIATVAMFVVPIIFSFWISDALTGAWSWFKVSFCLVSAIVALSAVVASKPNLSGIFAIAIPIVVGLLAAGSGRSRHIPDASEQARTGDRSSVPILQASVWGALPILASLVLLVVPWYVHVPSLFEFQPGRGFWDRFEVARNVTVFSRKSESRFSSSFGIERPNFEFDFASYSSPTALMKADRMLAKTTNVLAPQWTSFTLKNLHPKVDTNLQNVRLGALIIELGTIDSKQLEGLAATTAFLMLNNLHVQAKEKIKLSARQVYVSNMSAEQLQSFFEAIDPQFGPGFIYIQDAITSEHWPIIAKASLHFRIHCFVDVDKNLKQFPRVPTKKINVGFMRKTKFGTLLRSPAFCDSGVNFGWNGRPIEFAPLSSMLEVRLLLRGDSDLWNDPYAYRSISDWKNEHTLVYERDEHGNPLALLCPLPIDHKFPTAGLENLKTLTFDLGWIEPERKAAMALGARRRTLPPEPFAQLQKLERLAFPADYGIERLNFFNNLPNLRQLEIALGSAQVEEYGEFENLKALEHLILLDDPADELLEVLAKLKKLEQLTIVLPDSFGQTKSLQKSVKEILPKIRLSMIEEKNYQPDVPVTFKKHFSRVIQELKAKIAADEVQETDGN